MPSTINADNGVVSGSSGVKTTADTSGVLALQSNGSTGLTLDTNLNVGIGVTPSAWRSSFNVTYGERALELTYSALVTQAGPSTILANNVYFNSSNQWIYKNAVANTNAGLYTIGSNGVHSWSVAPTGASGAVATFTQAMTLDVSGELLIGTTSAGASQKLAIVGAETLCMMKNTSATSSTQRTTILFRDNGDNSVGTLKTSTAGINLTGVTGITFPATQSASADANTLDDYEEGNWTPTVAATTTNPTVSSYPTRVGRYVKIGKQVTIYCGIQNNSSGGSGNLKITGLPFQATSDDCTFSGVSALNGDFSWGTSKTGVLFAVGANQSHIDVYATQNGVAQAGIPVGNFNADSKYLNITLTYFV